MPKVGKTHYPYTPTGMKATKAASKRTGKPMKLGKTGKKKG
jgi:hypothetical protein